MEVDIETLQQLINLLPPEWQRHVNTALAVIVFVSANLLWLKPAAAKLITSPSGRYWADALFKMLDGIALNTRGLDTRPLPPPKKSKKS
jgi:hypothetical protein